MTGPLVTPLTVLTLILYSLLYSGPVDGLFLALCSLIRQDELGWPLVMQAAAMAIGAFALLQIIRIGRASWITTKTPQWKGPAKFILFPCRIGISHTWLSPKKHSFSGRCLLVGIPVEFEGNAGGMFSVGMDRNNGPSSWFLKGWFSIDPADYLRRGKAKLGLRGKLDEHLRSEGIDSSIYPHAYLVTVPRILGFQLISVSFWYLYDADKCLAAMIVEVNNAFEERRMYYTILDNDAERSFSGINFSSREGSCKLATINPLGLSMEDIGPLIVDLNLFTEGRIELAVRLTSEGFPFDPSKMPILSKLGFLTYCWWVRLVTVPRILKETAMFYHHKLHVWWRSEPLEGTIGRRAHSIERQLEPIFRRYLRHLADQSSINVTVKYVASGLSQRMDEVTSSAIVPSGSVATEELEIRVLTPAFYSRFPTTKLESSNLRQYVYFKLIQRLRVRPRRIKPVTEAKTNVIDIRHFYISPMDAYVMASEPATAQAIYRTSVLKLFLADRIALGSVRLFESGRLFLQACLAWFLSSMVVEMARSPSVYFRKQHT
ncbi:hypothetical protein QBC44DRAFT_291469 [Cladorrhinum sp. PSN332]|nr:hypothetical protein QBC44DRAFT_291469 [Cladorrhinum sp. PSN332]